MYVNWVLSLPKSKRPKTAAYPELDDPFSAPIVRADAPVSLEKAGIKTVYEDRYPSETVDMIADHVEDRGCEAGPDRRRHADRDGYALIKALVQPKYNPKFLFEANGANSPREFPDKVGASNTQGIFSASDWFPKAKTYGNPFFLKAVPEDVRRHGRQHRPGLGRGIRGRPGRRAARSKKVGLNNAKIIAALHQGKWPTVEGTLHWDAIGQPTGKFAARQWLGGNLYPSCRRPSPSASPCGRSPPGAARPEDMTR